ncbi:TRAP transporter small permease [Marinomonas colpomeniae]|uniref:TRAP transporter small permease protein n=1 Tax=Marinomonas colpomeniae TaxID=2774408 RepID=A0ABR8NYS8_9GAMM|nr:TRAP transporter small permease [Marinomonas colpomeniae]MBD5771201.1 TRAP transporter small permease [Marinomonas colpomeniae]
MFEKINKHLDKIEGFLIASILAVASLLTFTQVFFRYALNDSIFWAEEAILYLIISMSFLSTSLGIRKGSHITVDILKSSIPKSCIKFFVFIAAVIGALFALTLLYYGGVLFLGTLARGQLSPALRIPVAFIYAFIPITAFFQVIRYAGIMCSVFGESNETTIAINNDHIN